MSVPAVTKTAWMIEDDEAITRLVRFKLERSGWVLRRFATLAEFRAAWSAPHGTLPEVLVLDRNLPDGSGLDLARELAASGAGAPAVACLLLSASPRDADTPPGVQWMRKPFLPQELLELLESLLVHRSSSSSPSTASGTGDEVLDAELAALRSQYVASFPSKAEALRSAIARGDARELAHLAHQLAGSAGLYGCDALQRAAAELEDSLKAGEVTDLARRSGEVLAALDDRS